MLAESKKGTKLLKGIFELFSLTFTSYIIPLWLMGLLLLAEGIHLFLLPLTYIMQEIYSTSILNSFVKLLMNYSFLTSSTPIITFQIISFILLIFIIGFGTILTIIIYFQNSETPRAVQLFGSFIIQGLVIIEKLIAIPISIFIQIIKNKFISYKEITIEKDHTENIEFTHPLEENSATYTICLIISLILLMIVIILIFIVLNFSYDLDPKTKVITSYQKRNIHITIFIFKLSVIGLWALDPTFEIFIIHLVACLLLGTMSFIARIYHPPLKFMLLSYISTLFSVFIMFLYSAAFLRIITKYNLFVLLGELLLISNGFFIILVRIGNLRYKEQTIIVTNYSKSLYMMERILQLLNNENITDESYAEFMSCIYEHSKLCPNPLCGSFMCMKVVDETPDLIHFYKPCTRNLRQKRILTLFSRNPQYRYNEQQSNPIHYFIISIFNYLTKNYGNTEYLQVLRGYYEFYIEEHTCKSCRSMTNPNCKTKFSIWEKFFVYHLFKIIEKAHKRTYEFYEMDLTTYENITVKENIQYEDLYKPCMLDIEKSVIYSILFWNQILLDRPDHSQIIKSLKSITKIGKRINNSAKKLLAFKETNFHFLIKLLYFKLYIENNEKAAFDLVELIKKKSFNLSVRAKLLGGKHGGSNTRQTIKVSLESDTLGIIMDTSYEIEEILGYKRKEMIGRNNYFIMPAPIREIHNLWIKNFMLNMCGEKIGVEFTCFLYNKGGYYVKVGVSAMTVPNFISRIFQSMLYIEKKAFRIQIYGETIRATNKPFFLLSDLENNIFGFSKYAPEYINTDLFEVSGNPSRLSDVIPNWRSSEIQRKLKSESGIMFKLNENYSNKGEFNIESMNEENNYIAWGKLNIFKYGEKGSSTYMGYKCLSVVIMKSKYEEHKFTKLQQPVQKLAGRKSFIFDESDMKYLGESMEEEKESEEELLLGDKELEAGVVVLGDSMDNIYNKSKLLIYKHKLEGQLGVTYNSLMQIMIYSCFLLMCIIMMTGYIYITKNIEAYKRDFKLLEMAAMRLDRGSNSIPLAAVSMKNIIDFKQFLLDDEAMVTLINGYKGYYRETTNILLKYHNRIQSELTNDDKELWKIERIPVQIKELDKYGEITTVNTDLSTFLHMIAQRNFIIDRIIALGWNSLKEQYKVDGLFELKRELYFQVENGYEISRIQINLAIQKYIDSFLDKSNSETKIIYSFLICLAVMTAVIYLIVLVKSYKILSQNAKAMGIYSYIPDESIKKLLEKLDNLRIINIWAPSTQEKYMNIFHSVFSELNVQMIGQNTENIKQVANGKNHTINNIKKKNSIIENQEKFKELVKNQEEEEEEEYNPVVELTKNVKINKIIQNNSTEIIDYKKEENKTKIKTKIQHLSKMNKSVLKRLCLLGIILILCFILAFYPHISIVISLKDIFDEGAVFLKILYQRRPYLGALLLQCQISYHLKDTNFLDSNELFSFNYYYNNLHNFEKELINFQNSKNTAYPKFLNTIKEFNERNKYLEYLTSQTEYYKSTTFIVDYCINSRFKGIEELGLRSMIVYYMSTLLKIRNRLTDNNESIEYILSDQLLDEMTAWGYYCILPGIFYEMNIFTSETLEALDFYKRIEILGFISTMILLLIIYLLIFRYILSLLIAESSFRTSLFMNLPLQFIIHNPMLQRVP